MNKYKAILFDFDGTLANTTPGIVLTMQKTFEQMGLPLPEEEAVRQTIGLPLVEAVRILGKLTPDEADRGVEVYRNLFPVYEVGKVSIFPGVPETLERLKGQGVRMAVCTSRNLSSLETILKRFGLEHNFETMVTNNDGLPPKPAPDMVMALLDRMGVAAHEAVVVGDTTFDILMGNSAGCDTIAVTYGNHTVTRLKTANPTFVVDHFEDISQFL